MKNNDVVPLVSVKKKNIDENTSSKYTNNKYIVNTYISTYVLHMGCNELSYIQRTVDTVTDRLIEKNQLPNEKNKWGFFVPNKCRKGEHKRIQVRTMRNLQIEPMSFSPYSFGIPYLRKTRCSLFPGIRQWWNNYTCVGEHTGLE